MNTITNIDDKNDNPEPQILEIQSPMEETNLQIVEKKPLFGERFEFWATKIVIPAASAFGMIAVVWIISWQLSNQSQQMKYDAEKSRIQSKEEADKTKEQFEFQKTQLNLQAQQLKEQADSAKKQMAAEQFKNAIEHLGSEKQTVVLGGVHALHNLAMNYPKDYSLQVFEVLCSFIREETTKDEYQQRASTKPSIVIQTIVGKLFSKASDNPYLIDYANLSGAFLRGAILAEADLPNVFLIETNLQDVSLQGANLQGATLIAAQLQGADLCNADLRKASLKYAKLQGAHLWNAKLQEDRPERVSGDPQSTFDGADFRGVQTNDDVYPRVYFAIAVTKNISLETNLSGFKLYDDQGKELNFMNEEHKKEWFRDRKAKVDDLTAEEVQQLTKDIGIFEEWHRTNTEIKQQIKQELKELGFPEEFVVDILKRFESIENEKIVSWKKEGGDFVEFFKILYTKEEFVESLKKFGLIKNEDEPQQPNEEPTPEEESTPGDEPIPQE